MAEQYHLSGRTAAELTAAAETAVRDGRLTPGTSLPPVRRLASALGLSPATVAAAYRTLRQRGIVETAGRQGTRVRPRPPVAARGPVPLPEGVVDLRSGEPDPALLPRLGGALEHVPATPAGYNRAGLVPAFAALAGERFDADGVPPGRVGATGGALDAVDRTLTAALSTGDAVAVEDPCWANLRDLLATLGLRALPVPVDDDGPTPEGLSAALDAGARAAVLTSRAQNPTGAVVSSDRAGELRAILSRRPELLLIEDDHWAELSPGPLHPLVGTTDSWLFVRSASKPYGPDLRIAAVRGDATTVARLEGRMAMGTGWVSTLLQHLLLALWSDAEATAAVARAGLAYTERREALIDALAGHGVAAHGRSGLNVWIPVGDEAAAVAALRDEGYAVAAGGPHRLRSAPGLRVTVSPLAGTGAAAPVAAAVARALAAGGGSLR